MGLFRRVKAMPMPEADAPRAAWEGYEDLSEPGAGYAPGMLWMAGRAAAWTVFLSGAALAGYLLLSVSFMFRFYPNTYINDVDVSWMTVLEAGDALADAVSHDVTVRLRSGDVTVPASDLGIRVSYSPSVGTLAGGQSGYPWTRHDFRCKTEATYDKTEVLAAVNRLLSEHPERMAATQAGISFGEDGSMSYHDGTGAYSRDDAAARDLIASLVMAGAWEADITTLDCYDAPYALLPDADLENTARQWNARFESGMTFMCSDGPHDLDMGETALHASRSGSAMRVDGEWFRETVSGWTSLAEPSGGFSVRGVPVSDGAVAALHESRKLAYAERVASAFRSGASGVGLDSTQLGEWLSSGYVLALDGDAGWAVLYLDDEAVASCGATFHNGTEAVNDVLAVTVSDGKIVMSDGFTAGGAGCNVELADFQAISDALGDEILRCVVSLSQDGHPAASHSVPDAPAYYEIDFRA